MIAIWLDFLEKAHQDEKNVSEECSEEKRPHLGWVIEKMSRLADISEANGLKRQRHFYSFFILSISDRWVWGTLAIYLIEFYWLHAIYIHTLNHTYHYPSNVFTEL